MVDHNSKAVFVTVGSTKFDLLIAKISTPAFLNALETLGFNHLIVQHGNSSNPFPTPPTTTLTIETFPFNPSLDGYMRSASLIISHAGSGSILESFFLQKRLIVVPNETLMDNHQVELADALHEQGSLIRSSVEGIVEDLLAREWEKLTPKALGDPTPFAHIMEEEVGLRPRTFW
ncbi:N-acetylglucosaminyldiphosphodolichol N-acetylglucosaminyltransferase catalytic subunit alg13 [Dinochytrium kinnereticum]|nr:N-acetylglucosaminyldiphosphodolichol N-acetylglucosaminyltransferase catalytic subunit alg13 [Dinochytrium kinnereticum]